MISHRRIAWDGFRTLDQPAARVVCENRLTRALFAVAQPLAACCTSAAAMEDRRRRQPSWSCSVAACRMAPSRSRAHKLGLDARAALPCAIVARTPRKLWEAFSGCGAVGRKTHTVLSIRTTTLPTVRKHVLDRVGHALHSTHNLTPTHLAGSRPAGPL